MSKFNWSAANEDERFAEAIEYLKNHDSTEELGEFIDAYVGKLQAKMKVLHDIRDIIRRAGLTGFGSSQWGTDSWPKGWGTPNWPR